MNSLKIKYKLIVYFTSTFAILLGVVFLSIYFLSEENRKQGFYQRLKDQTITTLKILIEVNGMDVQLLQKFDSNTINNLYDEKVIIFNDKKERIYTSIDDTKISYSQDIINKLESGNREVKTVDNNYEVIGISFQYKEKYYYGIAKAYDKFGKEKIAYLRLVLGVTYLLSLLITFILATFLSNIITSPIQLLSKEVEKISIDNLSKVNMPVNKDEIGFLVEKFNELLDRLETSFSYQRNFIQHISHELKTPLAIMLTNAERSLAEEDPAQWRQSLEFQRSTTMELAHIINALIDISNVEINRKANLNAEVRIDELIFECIDEIGYLNPSVNFTCTVDPGIEDETQLTITGNKRMLKLAFLNLLKNAINYSKNEKASLAIEHFGSYVKISIENDGAVLDDSDQNNLFANIFRGKNAQTRKGLGMGLYLTGKIIEIHEGEIYYRISESGTNLFVLQFPDYHS